MNVKVFYSENNYEYISCLALFSNINVRIFSVSSNSKNMFPLLFTNIFQVTHHIPINFKYILKYYKQHNHSR